MAQSPCFLSPLADSPFAPPSSPLDLLGNPPSCDRIRPPWSQVACKLTSPFPTLSPIPSPFKFPEPRLLSASLWRPQESGFSCPEQFMPYNSIEPTMYTNTSVYPWCNIFEISWKWWSNLSKKIFYVQKYSSALTLYNDYLWFSIAPTNNL
jgi:hypothetical protein